MSIIAAISTPNNETLTRYHQVITSMSAALLPAAHDGKAQIRTSVKDGFLTAVLGGSELAKVHENSVFVGVAIPNGGSEEWWRLNESAPDGSFVIFRAEGDTVELISDYAGSRPIWYARLPCGGVAGSTCFELVIALLGSFELDNESLGWFLSAGNCGHGRSWDKRVKPVPRNTRLSISNNGAKVDIRSEQAMPVEKFTGSLTDESIAQELDESMGHFHTNRHGWLLALSGGCDSRALLHGVRNMDDVDCVTWADSKRRSLARGDVEIATQLASMTGRNTMVRNIRRPATVDEFDSAMRRFVRYNDGRTDDFIAYIDGMRVWDDISEMCSKPLLRGDEVFGTTSTRNKTEVMRNMRLLTFNDYPHDEVQKELAGKYNHSLPEALAHRDGETESAWRLRLRLEFETPTVYAALNNIRNRFTESICPLLTRHVLSIAEAMSDEELENKRQFKRVVGRMFPGVPFAQGRVILYRDEVIKLDPVQHVLRDHLRDEVARDILGDRVVGVAAGLFNLPANISVDPGNSPFGRMHGFAANLSRRVKDRFVRRIELNLQEVVMRSYIARLQIEEMNKAADVSRSTQKPLRLVSG